MKHKNWIAFFLIIILCFVFQTEILAQCPMCRMSAESNLKDGGTAARGLNNGILYIFAMPYLLVGFIGYVWWRNNKKHKLAEEQS